MLTLLLQVCSIFYLAMSSNGTRSKVSFIIYSAISMPPYFLVTFERLTKTFQFLKKIRGRNSRSYFNLFLIYAVVRDGLKYKPSEI